MELSKSPFSKETCANYRRELAKATNKFLDTMENVPHVPSINLAMGILESLKIELSICEYESIKETKNVKKTDGNSANLTGEPGLTS